MRRMWCVVATTCCVMGLLSSSTAWGQMFGQRQLGRPLSRQSSPGLADVQEQAGTLTGRERFLRQNRRPDDFVGPTLDDLQRFVGVLQATMRGETTSAVEGIRRRVDRSATINTPVQPAPRGGMYYPRIELGEGFAELKATESVSLSALDTLSRSPHISGSSRIAVLVEGRTARLQGEVPSAKDRDLAEVLLSFEPGISEIRNDLVVNPQLQVAPDSIQEMRTQREARQVWKTLSNGSREATRQQHWEMTSPAIQARQPVSTAAGE